MHRDCSPLQWSYLAQQALRDRYLEHYYVAQRWDPETGQWDTVDDNLTHDQALDVWREVSHSEPDRWRIVVVQPRVVSGDWEVS